MSKFSIVFNGHHQLVSDIDQYIVVWMPIKLFVVAENLLFDFELLIGERSKLSGNILRQHTRFLVDGVQLSRMLSESSFC